MDCIGEGLSIRTCSIVRDLRMGGFEVDDAWQKYPLHPFLQEVEDVAMTHFDRETGFCDHILHPFSNQFLIRGIGKNDPVTQFRKECFPEGKHLMEKEDPSGIPISGASGGRFSSPS